MKVGEVASKWLLYFNASCDEGCYEYNGVSNAALEALFNYHHFHFNHNSLMKQSR